MKLKLKLNSIKKNNLLRPKKWNLRWMKSIGLKQCSWEQPDWTRLASGMRGHRSISLFHPPQNGVPFQRFSVNVQLNSASQYRNQVPPAPINIPPPPPSNTPQSRPMRTRNSPTMNSNRPINYWQTPPTCQNISQSRRQTFLQLLITNY